MPAVLALLPGATAAETLRRTLPAKGPWRLVRCRTAEQAGRTLQGRLVDAVVFSPVGGSVSSTLLPLRERYPEIPWIACHPFRADDCTALLECEQGLARAAVVLGVDDPVAGELVVRHSAAAERRRALDEAPRILRLTEPLQQKVWFYLLDRVDEPVRTAQLAARLQCSREHLSRQFGAGGAPNLKRVIDLTRVACAAALLRNPGYDASTVARVLRFATASHLSATARRIAGVTAGALAALGPRGVLHAFVRGKTRSRL
jgi:AraC-like DNA-binding protein